MRPTMKRERFFAHVYYSNETVFTDNCDDWSNENVSFGARNCECLFHGFISLSPLRLCHAILLFLIKYFMPSIV